MPDRLASQIVNAVVEVLGNHGVLITPQMYPFEDLTEDINNAMDVATEEVEKLLRED